MKYVEGVPYRRYHVHVCLHDGKQKRLILWSPGEPWLDGEARRAIDARFGAQNVSAALVEPAP